MCYLHEVQQGQWVRQVLGHQEIPKNVQKASNIRVNFHSNLRNPLRMSEFAKRLFRFIGNCDIMLTYRRSRNSSHSREATVSLHASLSSLTSLTLVSTWTSWTLQVER